MSAGVHQYVDVETAGVGQDQYLRRIAAALQVKGPGRSEAVAEIVMEGLQSRGQFYYNAKVREFKSAYFFDRDSKELDRVHSDRFKQIVSDTFAINRASGLWSHVFAEIENASIGPASIGIEAEAFWASRPGALYLSNGPGSIYQVTGAGTKPVDNGTDGVLFLRGATLAPWSLTDPKDPFESCRLFNNLNATAGYGPLLAKLWAMSLPTTPKNKPPLCLAGAIGSGKTRYAVGLCELFGMPGDGRVIKVEENAEADFWPVMDAGGIVVLDNADTRVKWLADAVAAAATGAGQPKRRLYTDGDIVTMRSRGWIVITTARPDSFAGDAGLADRLLIVRMERRSGDTKDSELSEEIAANRNAGLSWICAKLSAALADDAIPPGSLNRRHPDFARFAFRLGRALGRESEAVAALSAAEADKSLFCLESDSVGTAVLALIKSSGSFQGGAKELVEALKEEEFVGSDWQLSPKSLGRRLDGLWPHLNAVMDAQRDRDRKGITRYRFATKRGESDGPGGVAPGLAHTIS